MKIAVYLKFTNLLSALWELGRLIHEIRIKWNIQSNCPCGGTNGKLLPKNGIAQVKTTYHLADKAT